MFHLNTIDMSKKKENTVSIRKNGVEKSIPKQQWDAMKKTKSTYGWRLSSDLPEEVLSKDKQLEASKVTELEAQVSTLTTKLKEESTAWELAVKNKDAKIAELEAEVKKLTPAKEPTKTPAKDDKGTSK